MNPPVSRKTWLHLAADLLAVTLLTALLSLAVRSPEGDRTIPPEEAAEEAAGAPTEVVTPVTHREIVESLTPAPPLDLKRLRAGRVKVVEHEIKIGENYWSIAKDFNLNVKTLLGANPDMPFTAEVGQTLRVPSEDGVLHPVEKGESLKTIASLYGVEEKSLKDANRVSWWAPLRAGDVLFVPEARPVKMAQRWKEYYDKRGMFGVPFAEWGKGWTSRYGVRTDPITGEHRMHRGMDFKSKYGTAVFASAGGRVTFTGVSGGYGNLIIISHGKGYTTYYGHLSRIEAANGQKVRRGQRIGRVGTSGRVTGPHLHFEIRKNGKQIDPLPLI